ncbi:MAG: ferritin family protein [Bacillota bacterium]
MLSQKELLALQAAVTGESLVRDKYGFYASQAVDPQIKQIFQRVHSDEERHLQSLVQYISQVQGQQSGTETMGAWRNQ